MKKALGLVIAVIIAVFAVMGQRWYQYVTAAPDPYDEVGIELNSRMPLPLRKWGCYQLQKRFGDQLPPYGCTADDGKNWM